MYDLRLALIVAKHLPITEKHMCFIGEMLQWQFFVEHVQESSLCHEKQGLGLSVQGLLTGD